MKKIFTILLLSLIAATLGGCDIINGILFPYTRGTGALDYVNLSKTANVSDGFLNIYYLDDNGLIIKDGEVPYVNAKEFLWKIQGAINYLYMDISTTKEKTTFSTKFRMDEEGNKLGIEVDFVQNLITIDEFLYFDLLGADLTEDPTKTIEVESAVFSDAQSTLIDLTNYDMNLFISDGMYLMPFHLANLLYSGDAYDVFFNGDKIYGYSASQLDDEAVLSQMYFSSYNYLSMSTEYKEYCVSYTALLFDHFYGLKEEVLGDDYTSFNEYLDNYSNKLIDSNDDDFSQGMRDFIVGLDDSHSGMILTGIYQSIGYELPKLTLADLGPRRKIFEETRKDLFEKVKDREMFEYLDNDKTLVVYFTGFDGQTLSDIKDGLKEYKNTVENIVIDLSYNTGGNLGVTIELLGFLTDGMVPISYKNPTDLSTTTAQYKKTALNTTRALSVNWYILTSKVTFSAANLMTFIAKDNNLATIIGDKSSGGACAIAYEVLPDGTMIVMSGTFKLTDDNYDSIEYGIDVDYQMNDVTDRNELISLINGLK
ncbi:S41 family peptidase [Acholeplasma sp. OttesenSCG-928-E16]|nr:S41 family peptidase [Acholeplasma sp. OttesenSCG-928-E16]